MTDQIGAICPVYPMRVFFTAGKTSILCHLANVAEANRAVVKTVGTSPTVGVQMVEFRRRNVRWVAWDMSGQGASRDTVYRSGARWSPTIAPRPKGLPHTSILQCFLTTQPVELPADVFFAKYYSSDAYPIWGCVYV